MKTKLFLFFITTMFLFTKNIEAQMVLHYDTNNSAGTTITLPLGGTVIVSVDWGDGTPTENFTTAGNQDHTYATAGDYTVSITGSLTHFGSVNYANADKLTSVTNWDGLGITSFQNAFQNATNLT